MKNLCLLAVLTQWMVVQAYDQHLNMILGEVEEVVTTVEIDDETYEEIVRVRIYSLMLKSRRARKLL